MKGFLKCGITFWKEVFNVQQIDNLGIEINAGHDLNLDNLKFFATNIPNLKEVSIGHALIADALNYGMENTVNLYLRALLK